MYGTLERCTDQHRRDAEVELVAELADFSYDGLVELQRDLERGGVLRGSWAGCVISYKRGAAGSTRRDRLGRARNAFTVLWDNGWITDEEVCAAVAREIRGRRAGHEYGTPGPARRAPAPEATPDTVVVAG